MKRFIYLIIVGFSLLLVLSSCSSGSGSSGGDSSDDTTEPQVESISEYFPEVDVNGLLANQPETIIHTISNNAEIRTVSTNLEKVEIGNSLVLLEATNGSSITFSSSVDFNNLKIGLPLFVDDVFKGMVRDINVSSGNVVVTLGDAKKISDVYESFDIMFQNDTIIRSLQRSLASQNIKGRYDYLNKDPLQISIVEKSITNARGLANNELILRIDIPEGYQTPIEPRDVSCSFTDLECSLTTQGEAVKNIDLGKTYGANGLTFSTAGSYVEIGIGSYLRAHYDYDYIGTDTFDFDLSQSAYFKSNMSVSISGELSKSWEAEFQLMDNFTVEIAHPHSAVAKTTVVITPQIVFGVNGKIKGSVTVNSFVERSGDVRVSYDSADGSHSFNNSVVDTPQNINKDGITLSLEAEGNAYIFPAINILPTLTFARIGPSITMINLRSGIKLNTNINGKIETGFVVENEGEITQNITMEANLTTSIEGLIQGKWLVRITPLNFSDLEKCYDFTDVTDVNESTVEEISNKGETDACFILYQTKDFKDILSIGKKSILEWKATLLNTPIIEVKEHPGDYNKRDVSFNIDIDEKLQTDIHYYYTLGGEDIFSDGIESHSPLWKLGDMPIEIEKNTKVKVRAVLYNEDVSESIWAWGTSISLQEEELVSLINKPDVIPTSRAFEDSLWISMTQDQGYEIMYQLDSAAAVKYFGSFEIKKDTRLVVYARDEVDGVKVYSKETTYEYDKCEEDEELENGVCVIQEDDDSPIYYKPATVNMNVSIPGYTRFFSPVFTGMTLGSVNDGPNIYPAIESVSNLDLLSGDIFAMWFSNQGLEAGTYEISEIDFDEEGEITLLFSTADIVNGDGSGVVIFEAISGTVTLEYYGVNYGDRLKGTISNVILEGRQDNCLDIECNNFIYENITGSLSGSFDGTIKEY